MAEHKALKLFMPAGGRGTKVGKGPVITLLMGGDNQRYLYEGIGRMP